MTSSSDTAEIAIDYFATFQRHTDRKPKPYWLIVNRNSQKA